MVHIKFYIIIFFLFIDYHSYSQINKINLLWEGGAEFKKPRITITLQKSENEDCRLYLIEENVCDLCANFENKIKKQEKKHIKCEEFDNLANAIKILNIGKLQLNNNVDYYIGFNPRMKIELYENDINVFSIEYISPQPINNFPIPLYPLNNIAKDIFKLAGIKSKKYCCRFNTFSQNNIDSSLTNYSIIETEKYIKANNLLIDAINSKNKNKNLISEIQTYLNENYIENDYFNKLSINENFLIYLYVNNWDSVYKIIDVLNTPKRRKLKIDVYPNYIYNLHNILTHKIFVADSMNNIINEVNNSDLSKEKKDFLKIYIPYYYSNYNIIDYTESFSDSLNTKYKDFKNNYSESKYTNYIELYDIIPSYLQFEYKLGFGASIFTENLSKNFISPPLFAFDFNFYLKKFFIGTDINLVFNTLKQDIEIFNDSAIIWSKEKDRVSSVKLGMMFGYDVLRSKKVVLSPSIGINLMTFQPAPLKAEEKRTEFKGINYKLNSLSFGLDLKYIFNRTRKSLFISKYSYCGLNLSYRFHYANLFNNPAIIKGNYHTITLSFFIHSIKEKINRI